MFRCIVLCTATVLCCCSIVRIVLSGAGLGEISTEVRSPVFFQSWGKPALQALLCVHGHSHICPTPNCRPRIESAGGLDSKAFGCIDGKYVCLLCLFASFSGAAPVFGRSPKIRSKKAAATTPWANCNSFASPVPCCGGRMLTLWHTFLLWCKSSCHLSRWSGLLLTTTGVDTKSRNTWKIKLLNDFALVPGVGWFATSWWGLMSSNALLCLTSTWHEIVSVRQPALWMQRLTKQFRRLEVDGSWWMKKM